MGDAGFDTLGSRETQRGLLGELGGMLGGGLAGGIHSGGSAVSWSSFRCTARVSSRTPGVACNNQPIYHGQLPQAVGSDTLTELTNHAAAFVTQKG
jgi:hypothetical protein